MFRRRSFLISCGSLAVAPAVTASGAAAAGMAVPLTTADVAIATEAPGLRIAGWDPADPQRAAGDGLWVQVSSSWQVAWR